MKKMITILLFLYGISIGLPDTALNFYSTRLRLDDGIMIILFLCVFTNLLHHPCRFTKSQLKFLKLVAFFAAFCLLSLYITLILGLPFNFYSLSRLLGCMLILITLSIALKSPKMVLWLGWGLLLGSGVLILQIIFRWHRTVEITSMAYFFRVKNALSFRTWDPNSTANYAIMFAFITALVSYQVSGGKKWIFWLAAGAVSQIPLFIFARGAMAGIGTAWLIYILLARRNWLEKAIVVMMLIGMVTYLLSIYQTQLIRSAVNINFSTGEGLSMHDIMWRRALGLIASSPLIGHGFGQEVRLYKTEFGGGMAHNAFLSVLVEGGLLGLLLFILPLGYLGCRFWRFAHGKFYDIRAVICFGFLLGIMVLSLSQSALYWHKSQMIILSLMVVCLGEAEKSLFCKSV